MSNKKYFNGWTAITIGIISLFAVFFVYPIFQVFIKSFVDTNGAISFASYSEFFSKKYYTTTIFNSIKVTAGATIISTVLGTALAYILRRVEIKGRTFLEVLVIISVLSPPFIGAYSWIILLGRSGIITQFINSVFGVNYQGIYGFTGILLVMSLKMFPLVYLYVSGALKSIDDSINEAAESLGSSNFERFFKVTIPLIFPTLLSSALLVFMRCLADFGTPMLIGEGYRTLPVLIYNSFISEMGGDESFGAAIAVIIVILTTAIFLIQKYIANRKNIEMTSLRPMEPRKEKGYKNALAYVISYFLVCLTFLPQIVVIITAFMKVEGKLFVAQFSLESFSKVMDKMAATIINTYSYSTISLLIILVLGVLTAYASVRKKNIFTEILDTIIMLPYVIPGSVFGIALIGAFNKPPLILSGTASIMIVAFVIRRLPYTIRSSSAILNQLSPSVEEASLSLGANQIKTFTHVTLPGMKEGIISGALMSWMSIISELSATIILYVGSTSTLSIAIYTEVIRGNYGEAAALSVILMSTTVIVLLLFFKLTGKKEIEL